jgi:hypothetical protein
LTLIDLFAMLDAVLRTAWALTLPFGDQLMSPAVRTVARSLAFSLLFLISCKQSPTDNAQNNGYVLPQPTPEFKGTIGTTYKDSKPDKIAIVSPPKGAPNVLMILIDDSGYGQWGTYGGQVPTPNLDRLARSGISFTRFHKFYGFIGGETNQWQPPLFRDTTPVEMEIPKGK